MKLKNTLPLMVAALFPTTAWADNTAAALATTDDYVNATVDRAYEDKSFFDDRFKATGTIRARVDSGDINSAYAGSADQPRDTASHLNADLWFSARIYHDWRAVLQIEPQMDLETGKMNGDHDIPMNKLYVEGTVYDKVKARIGKYGAFSSYGRVLDNEVTGAELFFDYKYPTKVAVARVTKHLNDNPWGAEVRREPIVYAQTVIPVAENVNLAGTAVYLKNVKRPGDSSKDAVLGEIGLDVKFNDDWRWMAAYSRSNIDNVRDSAGRKASPDGVFTEVKFKNADWAVRNSYDVFFNLRRVGAMSGISSVNDYSKNVQGAQLGVDYMLWKNLKLQTSYLHGKQVNATVGDKRQDVNVFRAQLEYAF
ncbi:hypothetical protein LVJ83_08555 [Uruburuella testudinis]|uniref:Phosphate-selective porin OprO/OprP n=1 Tax=Uruburuella testudinis TaxID=1282863 RepID=A0ABY4DQM3_9NEIS|nr:hypothetical protein [Uruburuella testudinis]UOO81029.1 hypothetical protein LVJ83_08555 [Uruburuella testudinis]